MATRLKQQVIDQIKADADLFAVVSKTLDIMPSSLAHTLSRQSSSRLKDYDLYKAISDHTQIPIEDLLEEIAEETESEVLDSEVR